MWVEIYEQHPGFGEWGRAMAAKRGFSQGSDGPGVILQAKVEFDQRPMADDHIVLGKDEFIVTFVRWLLTYPGASRPDVAARVYCKYNGKAPQ